MIADCTEFAATAEAAARIGGAVLSDWADRFTVSEKSRANLVTEADFASQQAIHEHIVSRYPDHGFLGEEGLEEGRDSAFCWVIDPLDGTSNYVHGFPYYGVSIALEHNGELIAGVVFDPNRDEMFTASRGAGATCNGQPLRPSDVTELSGTMAVASLPVAAGPDDPAVARFLGAMSAVQTVQRTGSAALNLVYVAAGRIDAYWSSSLKPWDVAAGALVVAEAGGRVSAIEGPPMDIRVPSVLASNGSAIHQQLSDVLTKSHTG